MQVAVLFLVGCVMLVAANDVCVLKKEPGMCLAYMPRWFYNIKTGECEKFIYGGCGTNGNNFESKDQCEDACPKCDLPAETGPCRAAFARYHYDSEAGECKTFTYGGCRGNSNNFKNMNDCQDACKED